MSVGTGIGLAMVIGAGVSAGTSIYNAKKQAGAVKDAAAQQTAAGEAAQAAQTPLYTRALEIAQQQAAQGQARLDPYAQQGQAGLTALSSFLGVPQPSASANAARSASLSPYAATPSQQAAANAFVPGAVAAQQATANNAAVAATGAKPMNVYGPSGYVGPGTPNGAPMQVPGSMVMLRAPNGQQQAVPAAQADYFLARGATRV